MGYPGRSLFGERSSNVQIKSGNTTIVVQKQGDTYYVQSNPDAPPTFKYDPLEFEISDDQLSFKAPAVILSEMQAAGRTGNPLGIMAFRNKVDYLTEVINKPDTAGSVDPNTLGTLAYKDDVDYETEVLNKPDLTLYSQWSQLGDLATKTQADWNLDIKNRPDLSVYQPLASNLTSLSAASPSTSGLVINGNAATPRSLEWPNTGLTIDHTVLGAALYQPARTYTSTNTTAGNFHPNILYASTLNMPTGAAAINFASTLNITGSPVPGTNCTITNRYALLVGGTAGTGNPGGVGAIRTCGLVTWNHIVPETTNLYDLGTTSLRFRTACISDLDMTGSVTGNFSPATTNTYQLGSTARRWNAAYINSLDASSVVGNLTPSATNTYSLGTSSIRWSNAYLTNLDVSGSTNGLTVGFNATRSRSLEWPTAALSVDHGTTGFLLNQNGGTINSTSTGTSNFYPNYMVGPTLNLPAAATIPYAATFIISGGPTAGTNCTITNRYGLVVTGGTNASNPGGVTGIRTQGIVTINHIVPETTNLYDLGTSTLRFRTAYLTNLDMAAAGRVFGSLLPNATNGGTLGSSSLRWGTTYTTDLNVAGAITGNLTPATTNTYDLGSSTVRWATAYLTNLDVSGTLTGNLYPNVKPYLVAGTGVTLTTDDTAKTITINATAVDLSAYLQTANLYTNTKPLLVAGTGISLTTDDTAKTITVAATGSGGSFQPLNQNLTDLSGTTATLYNNTSAAATFTVLRLLTPNLVYSSTNDTVPNAQIVLGRSEANGLSGLISYGYRSTSTPNYNRIGLGLYGNPYILSVSNDSVAAVKISATASSGGKTSGALVVTGGIGCGENISLAGQIFYQTAASAAGMYSFLKYSDAGNKQLWFQDSGNATSSNTYPTFRIGLDGTRSWLGSVSTDGTTTLPLYINSNLLPTTDNGYLCGSSSYRWSTVYSVNGVVTTSDENEKTEIVELTKGLEIVNELKPITYKFKTGDTKTHFGLGARKTKEVLDAQGFTNYSLVESSASPWGLNYSEVVAPLIKAVQQLSQQVTDLKTRISVLEQKTVRLPII